MEPYNPRNPLHQPIPEQPVEPVLLPVETGETQIEKSSSNPMPIVAALGIMGAIVLGWVLLAEPQGTQTASNTVAPPADTTGTLAPKQAPASAIEQGAREKVEPEK